MTFITPSSLAPNPGEVCPDQLMTTSSRAPITCHVLDTTTGRPASNLAVTLSLLSVSDGPFTPFTLTSSSNPSPLFSATTDADGRISNWHTSAGTDADTMEKLFAQGRDHAYTILWSLKFATGIYYGLDKTFWPEVEVKFWTGAGDGRPHVHVPLLLGPYGYTTYRGS